MPECELRDSHAKHILTDCVNLASLRLRFFYGSNPYMMKQVLEINKVNSKKATFLTGSNIKTKEKITDIQALKIYLPEEWSLTQ